MLPNTGYTDKTVLSPYRRGVCWHGIKKAEALGPERFCGKGAGRYRVSKTVYTGEQQTGFNPLTPSVEVREMWLCYKHVTAMETRGYVCQSIPEE